MGSHVHGIPVLYVHVCQCVYVYVHIIYMCVCVCMFIALTEGDYASLHV